MPDVDDKMHAALNRIAIRRYLDRGRVHERDDTEALKKSWAAAYERWINDPCTDNDVDEENIRAELLLRGVEMRLTDASPAAVAKMEELWTERRDKINALIESGASHQILDEIMDEVAGKNLQ